MYNQMRQISVYSKGRVIKHMRSRGKTAKSVSVLLTIVTAFVMLFGGIQAQPAFAASKPAAPSFLVEKYGSTEIKVTIKKVKGAAGYKVYRAKKKNGKYKAIKTFKKTKGSFVDKGLKASTKYYYKVKAYKKVSGKKLYGKYSAVKYAKTKAKPNGNAAKYKPENIALQQSDLYGRTGYFLGSSVTKGKGSANGNVSFVEMLKYKYGMEVKKSAVNGTTLVDSGSSSYIARLKSDFSKSNAPDYFICQLSTNDAAKGMALGTLTDGQFDMGKFDTGTVTGAIEYITAYAQKNWSCPVIFYIPTKPKDTWKYEAVYLKMIKRLKKIQTKWNDQYGDQIQIIDLWNHPDAQYKSTDDRLLCMYDTIHPTMAGYLLKYVPVIGDFLLKYIEIRNKVVDDPQPEEPVVDPVVDDTPASDDGGQGNEDPVVVDGPSMDEVVPPADVPLDDAA